MSVDKNVSDFNCHFTFPTQCLRKGGGGVETKCH